MQTLPSFVTHVDVRNSPALKWIDVPNATLNLTVLYTSVQRIDVVANSSVDYLMVTKCNLEKIPRTIQNAQRMRLLIMSSCKIDGLDMASLCANRELTTLILTNNKIPNMLKTVNIELFNVFVQMNSLFLHRNRIKSIAGRLVHDALLQLRLENNKLTGLDMCHWHVPSIVLVTFMDNPMKTIPECLNNLQNFSAIDGLYSRTSGWINRRAA
uniref:LRR-7030 n=1 Tax=Anopheles gambiae TaxID=7165 RepID=A0A1S4HE50_ANOGA